MTAQISGRDRLPSLTGLRFWAAVFVVFYHLARDVERLAILGDLAWFGRTGVTFFFVLSGFVLTWTYLDSPVRATVFWWRRFARIWPVLALSTVPTFMLVYVVTNEVSAWHVFSMLTLAQAWRPEWLGGANGAWSLSNEAFYLVFPLLLAMIRTNAGRDSCTAYA